jgi:hypothetical protein
MRRGSPKRPEARLRIQDHVLPQPAAQDLTVRHEVCYVRKRQRRNGLT